MTERDDNLIKYEPLRNLLEVLADEDDGVGDQIGASLVARGFDPKAIAAVAHETVQIGVKKQRLAWHEEARAKLERLQKVRGSVNKWVQRSLGEVDEAFGKVVQGVFGPVAQARVQAAFRNLDEVTAEDKASFLDDLEALEMLEKDRTSEEGE